MAALTKKARETLHNEKSQVEMVPVNIAGMPVKRVVVQFSLTYGEFLALKAAVNSYDSPVGQDVKDYLNYATEKSGIDI